MGTWPPTPRRRDAARHRYNGFDEEHLHCYGCAHSAVQEPFPGRPSGERPCQFCIRNPLHVQNLGDDHEWYDGSEPVSIPMDAYQTPDMRIQVGMWLDYAENAGQRAVENLLRIRGLLSEDDD